MMLRNRIRQERINKNSLANRPVFSQPTPPKLHESVHLVGMNGSQMVSGAVVCYQRACHMPYMRRSYAANEAVICRKSDGNLTQTTASFASNHRNSLCISHLQNRSKIAPLYEKATLVQDSQFSRKTLSDFFSNVNFRRKAHSAPPSHANDQLEGSNTPIPYIPTNSRKGQQQTSINYQTKSAPLISKNRIKYA